MIGLTMALAMGFLSAVALCFRALSSPQAVAAVEAEMRIVLDAGHGGVDGGVCGKNTGIKESDLNLAITNFLRAELEEIGFAVTLTRKTEAGLYGTATKGFKKRDMQRRKEIIEETNPDLVVSIHQNFYPSRTARGGQVFYQKTDDNAKRLAFFIQEKLNGLYEKEGAKKRVAQTGEYFMLQCAACPSVIVECGFLSNAKDEKLLTEEGWQKRLAQSIAAGIVGYFAQLLA